MGPYYEADVALAQEIILALLERQRINANKKAGSTRMVPQWLDEVNPSVFIHHDEIKARTGRTRMSESSYECLRLRFPIAPARTEIERGDHGEPVGLLVWIPAARCEHNEFSSLSQLKDANREDLERRPELDKAIY